MRTSTEKRHKDLFYTRVDAIVHMILENDRYLQAKRTNELLLRITERFDVGRKMAEIYLSEARKNVKLLGKKDKEKAFAKAMRDREYLFHLAKNGKTRKDKEGNDIVIVEPDPKLALDVIKDRDKLSGLYVDEVNYNVRNIDLSRFTETGLARIARGDSIEEVLMDPASVIKGE